MFAAINKNRFRSINNKPARSVLFAGEHDKHVRRGRFSRAQFATFTLLSTVPMYNPCHRPPHGLHRPRHRLSE